MAKTSIDYENWVRRFIPLVATDKGFDLKPYRTCELQHLTDKSTDEEDIWKIPAKRDKANDLLVVISETFCGMPDFHFQIYKPNLAS